MELLLLVSIMLKRSSIKKICVWFSAVIWYNQHGHLLKVTYMHYKILKLKNGFFFLRFVHFYFIFTIVHIYAYRLVYKWHLVGYSSKNLNLLIHNIFNDKPNNSLKKLFIKTNCPLKLAGVYHLNYKFSLLNAWHKQLALSVKHIYDNITPIKQPKLYRYSRARAKIIGILRNWVLKLTRRWNVFHFDLPL